MMVGSTINLGTISSKNLTLVLTQGKARRVTKFGVKVRCSNFLLQNWNSNQSFLIEYKKDMKPFHIDRELECPILF